MVTATAQTATGKSNNGKLKRRQAMASKSQSRDRAVAASAQDGRQQALSHAVNQIEKAFGKGSIMRLDDDPSQVPPGIPTGSISLDLALGGRGIPRGRVAEVFGPESSGKTTLTLHVIAKAQKGGGVAAFIDAEHALDPAWARRLGVNLEDLLVPKFYVCPVFKSFN